MSKREEDFTKASAQFDGIYAQVAFCTGCEHGYQYAKENLWYDAQGDIVPEYDREVIVIGRDGKVFFGHRPDPKGYVVVEGEKLFAKTYDKNGWNWPNIALWLDVEIPHEMVDKIATEYYKEKQVAHYEGR